MSGPSILRRAPTGHHPPIRVDEPGPTMPQSLPSKVLVITPHMDDAEFGAGGTVAKWRASGVEVAYVVTTNGDKGSEDPAMTSRQLAQVREREQRDACHALGVEDVTFLGNPDGGLDDTSAFREQLVRQIRIHQPEVVITSDPHRGGAWHPDHRVTGRVALDAIFPFARDRLSFPEHERSGLAPHKTRRVLFWAAEEPDYYEEVTETFDAKLAALRAHASQMPPDFDTTVATWVRQWCEEAGRRIGVPLAEAFKRIELPG